MMTLTILIPLSIDVNKFLEEMQELFPYLRVAYISSENQFWAFNKGRRIFSLSNELYLDEPIGD